jgi:hypothetical protein
MDVPRVMTAAIGVALAPTAALATAPAIRVQPQVMVGTGLTAKKPFEAWFVFDKSFDPRVPGYAVPDGARCCDCPAGMDP